eukprot:1229871-Rhodomonas_salina.1
MPRESSRGREMRERGRAEREGEVVKELEKSLRPLRPLQPPSHDGNSWHMLAQASRATVVSEQSEEQHSARECKPEPYLKGT